MTDLKEIHEAAKDLLDNTKAIKGEDFVRSARLAVMFKAITGRALHACACNNPMCGAMTALAIESDFKAAMTVLLGHLSKAEQEEMGNLLHTLEHLQNTARKAIHGENDGN